ncbi:MAG: PAS domain-containing protein [Bacteroidota bacterium]|nr:PAS domain-containing protein [Bacteroidota bacterium]
MKRIKLNLKNRILLSIILVPIAAIVAISIYASSKLLLNIRKIKEDYARNISSNYIDKVERNFYERYGDVQAFSYNLAAKEALINPGVLSAFQLSDFMNVMVKYYVLYDYMMVLNKNGDVIAYNTKNRSGNNASTEFLNGMNFSKEIWFTKCINQESKEPEVWVSDFTLSEDAGFISNDKNQGAGMAFACPIKDESDNVIGVWYNYSNWKEITQKIRHETEDEVQQIYPNSKLILTDKNGKIIDCDSLNWILKDYYFVEKNGNYQIKNELKTINLSNDFIISETKSKGAYTYEGKEWKAYALIENKSAIIKIILFEFTGILVLTILCISLTLIIAYYTANNISKRMLILRNTVNDISVGKLNETVIDGNDEITEMNDSINDLVKKLKLKSDFANKIGNQELNATLEISGENDVLGTSLLTMRDSLKLVAQEEKQRNWATEGLAKFTEILRSKADLETICYNSLVQIIKYLGANQGGVFLINDTNSSDKFLELRACYAYDRRKYIDKKIYPKEGLVGQCFIEKEEIYLSEIPKNYVYITSGTGKALPKSVLLMPLINNEEIEGVIELASLKEMEPFEIDFVRKVADNIAAMISSAKINEQTKQLLAHSQEQAEEMRSQEEEMRQNMEELLATQEEMARKQSEKLAQTELLSIIVDNIPFPIFIKDDKGKYVLVNKAQSDLLSFPVDEIIGNDDSKFIKNEDEISKIRKSDQKIVQENVPVHFPEQELHLPNNTIRVLKTSKIPFIDKLTGKIHILGVSIDVSEAKANEKSLMNDILELRKRLEGK